MNVNNCKNVIFMLLAATVASPLCASTVTHLEKDWRIESACKLTASGAEITMPQFNTDGWLSAQVPSTVLAAQVKQGVEPDPYYGDNLRKLPGMSYPVGQNFSNLPMSADSPYACGWWYRTEFSAPDREADGRYWLHFGGINYRGEVWLNGHKVADRNQIAGAYRTYDLDVTEWMKQGKPNVLAVETFAPTEKDLGINWVDWNPCPPDKDMGLWGAVDLLTTGPVTLRSPAAFTHFIDGDTSKPELTVYAELHNASDKAIQGAVSGTAAGVSFEKEVELAPHEDKEVVFSPEVFPQLKLRDAQLWWPYQMGEPHLEKLDMKFSIKGRAIDVKSTEFGIREVTSEYTTNGSRLFRVNGKPILIRGAGWSQDMLLRTNDERLRDQIRLVKDMHLNTIRLEGKLETEDFFRMTDQQGILVMLGWCCCDHWEHWADWTPEDLTIATASLHAQMLRLRQHASLLVWLNGSDNPPPANVEKAYLDVESETHWPNPTLSSASSTPTTVTGESGVKMTGPYDYVPPSYWYVDKTHGGAFGFNTETSPGPAIPSLASRKKFLPDPNAWPPTATWSLHFGGGEFKNLRVLDAAMDSVYAEPHSAAEYERMAQTMEYDSERAMYEAYSRNKYSSTGVIQWMLNNAWPSMIWHLYDYYLDAGGGYFGTKKACEPVHIQYSYDDQSIVVVNSMYQPVENLSAKVQVYDLHWKKLFDTTVPVNAAADSAQRVALVPENLFTGGERIFFIDLTLTDVSGKLVSHNFYWVPDTLTTFDWEKTDYTHTPALRHENLNALTSLPSAAVSARAELEKTAQGHVIKLHLSNSQAALAFQLRAAIRTAQGDLVAPVIWSDNWIELKPGETTTLTALLPDSAPESPVVKLEGWNVAEQTIMPKVQ